MRSVLSAMVLMVSFFVAFAEDLIKEGWIDENTFRVTGVGYINPAHANQHVIRRRKMACQAAQIDAKAKMIKKFAHAGIKSVKGKVITKKLSNAVIEEFSGTIKGGRVVKRIFDPRKNSCEVIYQIQEKNLKRKTMEFIKKYDVE